MSVDGETVALVSALAALVGSVSLALSATVEIVRLRREQRRDMTSGASDVATENLGPEPHGMPAEGGAPWDHQDGVGGPARGARR